MRISAVAVVVTIVVATIVVVTAAGCEPECTDGGGVARHGGESFAAPDGCNTCTCQQDNSIACTELACEGEGEGEGAEGEGEGAVGPVVPIPTTECDVLSQRGNDFDLGASFGGDPAWSLQRAPVGSHASLLTPDGTTTSTLHADAFGLYVVRQLVGSLVVDCYVRNLPTTGVAVELSWDSAQDDLDLHVTKADANGDLCISGAPGNGPIEAPFSSNCGAQLDCNYANCKGFGPSPDWDGAGSTAGEPKLLIDDLVGYGPEIVVVDTAVDGTYAAAIVGFQVPATTTAWARLWIDGQLVASHAATLAATEQPVLPAFRFTIGGGQVCVDDLVGGAPLCTDTPSCTDPAGGCAQCTQQGDTNFDGLDDVADEDGCGTGIHCDAQATVCVPDNAPLCAADVGCEDGTAFQCFVAANTCVTSECSADADCANGGGLPGGPDPRSVCSAQHFCVLPPAQCSETDEPNNDVDGATVFALADGYSGTLCRGDVDVLGFAVVAGKRYRATLTSTGTPQDSAGNVVALVDADDNVLDTQTVGFAGDPVTVTGDAVAAGRFFIRVTSLSTFADQLAYTVDVVESDTPPPPSCTNPPEEPNDAAADAGDLALGTTTFARCGLGDVDFYRVSVAALHGVDVTLGGFGAADGALQLEVFDDAAATHLVASGAHVVLPELPLSTAGAYVLKVSLGAGEALTDESYTLSVVDVPRPAACNADANEPDADVATAATLTLVADDVVATDRVRCDDGDVDEYRFTVPPGKSGVVLLRFAHAEGDLRLDLLDDNGDQIGTSNVSTVNSDPDEQVDVAGDAAAAVTFIARVRLATAVSSHIVAQLYTIEVHTFDDSVCLASEPTGGDDSFESGLCIGDFTPLLSSMPCVNDTARLAEPLDPGGLAACEAAADGAVAGCGRVCGNSDSDWVRAGILVDDQVLHAVLDYDVADGALQLVRGTLQPDGLVAETATADDDGDGHVELSFVAPRNTPKEYGVRVTGSGAVGHQLERYALTVEIGPTCTDDDVDAAGTNETPATATQIRPVPDLGQPFTFDSTTLGSSRCDNDVDVYEILAFAGETVSVDLTSASTSPSGLVVEIGTRPADLNNDAVAVAVAAANAGPATFDNGTAQQLFVTVKTAAGAVVTGAYALTVSTTP